MLFWKYRMVRICSTEDSSQRQKVQDALNVGGIAYKIGVKDNNSVNSYDRARLGNIRGGLKLTYSFYVKKEDAEAALFLIRG